MKRIGNLFDEICSIDNLRLADEKARKGKLKSYGVVSHDKNRENNLIELHNNLLNGNYKTSEYDIFKIYEPKERDIYRLPYFPDRIVHHAIMNILEPIWVSVFTSDTYSCIKNRGIHKVLFNLKVDLKNDVKNTTYCLKIDIKKFYPSIDHAILKVIIRKKIKDKRLLLLLDEIINSANGVPIGNYLSQYFANLYLSYFDHWIKEVKKIKYYYRYADDMVFLYNNKKELFSLLKEINIYMKSLNLQLKKNYQIFPLKPNGIDFVGYVFYHTHIKLRKRIKQNLCRKAKKYHNTEEKIFNEALSSYWGWAKHCNSVNLLNKLKNESK